MIIGIPKEVKTDEYRVGITPSNVAVLFNDGHDVIVQSSAGEGSGYSDKEYLDAGGKIATDAKSVYDEAELIIKVKEPQQSEYKYLNERHTLFCYLHLAPIKELATVLIEKKLCAIAYETVSMDGELPLLKPMSEIAGKMATNVAAYHLSRYNGGSGVLIGGASGVKPANVLIIGAGNAGSNAAKVAFGMGADVTIINRSSEKFIKLNKSLPSVKTVVYSKELLEKLLEDADIVISCVLIHGGASTPKLITNKMMKKMKKGSIVVDIAIDQGGISESSRPTTHTSPTFVCEGVLNYCVANMPGAYPKTASPALSNATLEYIRELANKGTVDAAKNNKALALGVNTFGGYMINSIVAQTHGFEHKELDTLI